MTSMFAPSNTVVLEWAVNSTALPPGRICGQRWVYSPCASSVTGVGVPPVEGIRDSTPLTEIGKLTMNDTDLEIVGESQHSPFEFSLPEYNRQLTAGYSKNTASHGLIVYMRDLTSLSAQSARQ